VDWLIGRGRGSGVREPKKGGIIQAEILGIIREMVRQGYEAAVCPSGRRIAECKLQNA
jgi:hypothetical protein